MGFLKPLLLLIAIPAFGYGVGAWVLGDVNQALAEQGIPPDIKQLCTPAVLAEAPGLQELCNDVAPVLLLQKASLLSAVVAIALLLSFVVFAAIAGKDRQKITIVFPALVFVSLLVLSGLVLVQGAVVTYGAYLAESHAVGRVHFILIGGVGLAAVAAAFGLIGSSFKMAKKRKQSVLGTALTRQDHPRVYSFVDGIAEKLGARSPDQIVVGLEPNFYVTNADIAVMGGNQVLRGQTLYMSLPLARILTENEITGVIGHELGHFRGKDTFYSMKFAPVYAGLTEAIRSIDSDKNGNGARISTLPAIVLLSYMIDVFHKNVSAISRDREFEADRAGAEAASGSALATSLLKLSLYAQSWNRIQEDIVARLRQGKVTRNMSLLFSNIVKYDVDQQKLPDAVRSIGGDSISHPTDSHPPTSTRIEQLGFEIDNIETDSLMLPAESAVEIIDGYRELEERLTVLQQQYYSALGVNIPDEEQGSIGPKILSAFGAHMVLADGHVDPDEIEQAESIGMSLTESFDVVEFREFCHHPDSLPKLDNLIEVARKFESDLKDVIVGYVTQIASADNAVSTEEQQMLDLVKSKIHEEDVKPSAADD